MTLIHGTLAAYSARICGRLVLRAVVDDDPQRGRDGLVDDAVERAAGVLRLVAAGGDQQVAARRGPARAGPRAASAAALASARSIGWEMLVDTRSPAWPEPSRPPPFLGPYGATHHIRFSGTFDHGAGRRSSQNSSRTASPAPSGARVGPRRHVAGPPATSANVCRSRAASVARLNSRSTFARPAAPKRPRRSGSAQQLRRPPAPPPRRRPAARATR